MSNSNADFSKGTGFMGTYIEVFHVGADGTVTPIETLEDIEKIMEESE